MDIPSSRQRRVPVALLFALLLTLPLAACGGEGDGSKEPPAVASAPGPDAPSKANPPAMPPAHPPIAPEPVDPETVVLSVNGTPVTQGRLDEELRRMIFRGAPVPEQQMAMARQRFGAQAEESVIGSMLMQAAVESEGITASDEDLAARWKEIDGTLPQGITRAQALAQQGMTQERADGELRKAILFEKLLDRHAAGEPLSDERVKQHYEENIKRFEQPERVQARHILLKLDANASEEDKVATLRRMHTIRDEAAKEGGKSFEELAKQHSACPSGAQGGDLGLFTRGRMVPEFDTLAFTLEPGVVSEPFTTQFGYHILRVEKRVPAGVQPFDEVEEQLKQQLVNEARTKAQRAYIDRLRASATIERPEDGK